MISAKRMFAVLLLSTGLSSIAQEKIIKVDNGIVEIYVEDYGKGQPLVFVPGWTMTTKFFEKQQDYFQKHYRFITYDPRSHGNSTKTTDKNTYSHHADDLKNIVESLELKNIILVGWSSGCATIFEFIEKYGETNIDKLVLIDEPPKWIGDSTKEWVYGNFDDYRVSLKDLINDREKNSQGIVNWMLNEDVSQREADWMVKEMLKTPLDAALSLYIDGMASDYTTVLKKIDSKTPTLYLLRESWYDKGKAWLQTYTANIVVKPISSHAMFWERPIKFNTLLEVFIKK